MNINYSNKLDLEEFFYCLKDDIYAVVKLSDVFPNYYPYSDIDLFCFDLRKVSDKILEIGNNYVRRGFKIIANCDSTGTKAYIDFYATADAGRLDFRFDLLTRLPEYNKLHLKPALFYSILENRIGIRRRHNGRAYDLSVPSTVDDVLLRYIEYVEWYEQRPDKVKHLEFVLSKLEEEPELRRFTDKLHLYTELRQLEIPANSHFESVTANPEIKDSHTAEKNAEQIQTEVKEEKEIQNIECSDNASVSFRARARRNMRDFFDSLIGR